MAADATDSTPCSTTTPDLFLTRAQLGGRRAPSAAAVVRVARPHRSHRAARAGAGDADDRAALSASAWAAAPRARNAVSRAARVRRPAADRLPGRPLPRLGHAAGRATASGRCSTRATSSSDESATAEPAELPHADMLVMESRRSACPRYRMPPRADSDRAVDRDRPHRAGRRQDAGDPRLSARQVAGSDEAAHRRTASACCSTRRSTRSAASTKSAACDLGDVRRVRRRAAGRARGRHAAARHERLPPGQSRPDGLDRADRLGRRRSGPSIAGASTMRSRSRTTPTSISSSKPSAGSSPREVYCTHGPDRIRRPPARPGLQRLPAGSTRPKAVVLKYVRLSA